MSETPPRFNSAVMALLNEPLPPASTLMERVAALEARVKVLEAALARAFGRTWMDMLVNDRQDDEPPSQL